MNETTKKSSKPSRDQSHYQPMIDLDGKSILITGGTGSFGRAFTRAIVDSVKPARLVIFSRDEQKQYEMAQSISPQEYPFLRYFIGDVRDRERLEMAMRGIDYVIHAAALKHVPTAEYNPFECIQTNVYGAENIVRASINAGVERVIALSTDKAANPINLYGASKLASDKIFVAANALSAEGGPRFAVVRYGNVLGSRGSVVPYFRALVAEGAKSVPITDEKMTRFWITLGQGVDFVLSSLALMMGGEIFVPKIPSMKIVDLAHALAPGLAHDVVGIRPGEKLHEVLISHDDARKTIEFTDRYLIEPSFNFWVRGEYDGIEHSQVEEGFHYSSDTNDEWLTGETLERLLARN
ncbi:MAG: UDP-N-acetylglucosamine 4,6-dehydratase (inverting) [Alphaproteobacteria bacterium]